MKGHLFHTHFGTLHCVGVWTRAVDREMFGTFNDMFGNVMNLPIREVFITR